jgi:hypothetical protein
MLNWLWMHACCQGGAKDKAVVGPVGAPHIFKFWTLEITSPQKHGRHSFLIIPTYLPRTGMYWLASHLWFLWRKSRDGRQPRTDQGGASHDVHTLKYRTSFITQGPTNKMPPKPIATQKRLKNITTCLTITANSLEMLVDQLNIPFLTAISRPSLLWNAFR